MTLSCFDLKTEQTQAILATRGKISMCQNQSSLSYSSQYLFDIFKFIMKGRPFPTKKIVNKKKKTTEK